MKRKTVFLLLLAQAILWLSYLAACTLLPISVDDRVSRFLDDLNGDRSTMYLNFHPDILLYEDVKDPLFWDAIFSEGEIPYSISTLDTSDPSSVTFTLTSTLSSWDVEFVMMKSGLDWMISIMYLDGGAVPVVE